MEDLNKKMVYHNSSMGKRSDLRFKKNMKGILEVDTVYTTKDSASYNDRWRIKVKSIVQGKHKWQLIYNKKNIAKVTREKNQIEFRIAKSK